MKAAFSVSDPIRSANKYKFYPVKAHCVHELIENDRTTRTNENKETIHQKTESKNIIEEKLAMGK